MRYLASTSHTLFILQLISLITILIGLFVVPVNWAYIVASVMAFYCYSILGISMMMHRFYSHKSFQLHPIVKWIFTVFAILAGRGSPLGWVYIHRMHHATSDTEKDPHSPHFDNFNIIGFKPVYDESKKINYFVVKELLTPAHINIDRYYMLCIGAFVTMLSLINPVLIFYVWAVPVFAVSVSQVAFNYFAHKHGDRNFVTKDCSTNNVYLWPFILGDAWHNNHHAHAEKVSSKIKKHEYDPVVGLINLIRTDR
jgi:stearoyl-CoA desaturase (delta-9 desaturase)